jgi:hypothetical protein
VARWQGRCALAGDVAHGPRRSAAGGGCELEGAALQGAELPSVFAAAAVVDARPVCSCVGRRIEGPGAQKSSCHAAGFTAHAASATKGCIELIRARRSRKAELARRYTLVLSVHTSRCTARGSESHARVPSCPAWAPRLERSPDPRVSLLGPWNTGFLSTRCGLALGPPTAFQWLPLPLAARGQLGPLPVAARGWPRRGAHGVARRPPVELTEPYRAPRSLSASNIGISGWRVGQGPNRRWQPRWQMPRGDSRRQPAEPEARFQAQAPAPRRKDGEPLQHRRRSTYTYLVCHSCIATERAAEPAVPD